MVAIAAGYEETVGLLADGRVMHWGDTSDGTGVPRHDAVPVEVPGLRGAVALDAGLVARCAIRSSGAVMCWGEWAGCWLTDTSPRQVPNVTDAVEVAVGGGHVCARSASGAVLCWGANTYGELGIEDPLLSHTCPADHDPAAVPVFIAAAVRSPVAITSGGRHLCALRRSGRVVCWGSDESGQLGDGATTLRQPDAVEVRGLTDAVEVDAGDEHTCARRRSGQVVCWGGDTWGQLGDGGAAPSMCQPYGDTGPCALTPVPVPDIEDAVQIAAGGDHSCALRASGEVVCWGSGALGDGRIASDRSLPVTVRGIDDAVAIATGLWHSCARRATGEVLCWGKNSLGQLGDGTTDDRYVPTHVIGL